MKRYMKNAWVGVRHHIVSRLLGSRWGERKARRLVDGEVTDFFNEFELLLATTDAHKMLVGQLRHHVYCEEMGFEPISESGIESDPFDAYSHHCMVMHKHSGQCVASLRIVLPSVSAQKLPIEINCAHAFAAPWQLPTFFAAREVCEISRLAVAKAFRRRGAGTAIGGSSQWTLPLTLYLYLYAANYCALLQVKQAYMLMEPKLARSMRLLGVSFEPLGAPVDYHGMRVAYRIAPDTFLRQLSPLLHKLQVKVRSLVKTQYQTASKDASRARERAAA